MSEATCINDCVYAFMSLCVGAYFPQPAHEFLWVIVIFITLLSSKTGRPIPDDNFSENGTPFVCSSWSYYLSWGVCHTLRSCQCSDWHLGWRTLFLKCDKNNYDWLIPLSHTNHYSDLNSGPRGLALTVVIDHINICHLDFRWPLVTSMAALLKCNDGEYVVLKSVRLCENPLMITLWW